MNKLNVNGIRKAVSEASERFFILFILLILCIGVSIAAPSFLAEKNLINVLRQISFTAVVAFGATFVLTCGGIDLSPGSVVSLVSIVSAICAKNGQPAVVCLLAGLAVGALCGFINGLLIAKTGIPPFIVTMSMMSVAAGAALLISDGRPISGLSEGFVWLGAGKIWIIPVPILILALVALICHVVLNKTTFGRHLKAVGSSENAATMCGINVTFVKIMAYTIAGITAGLAAVMLTARLYSGQPNAGDGMQMDAIAAAVIGGTSLKGGVGTILGTICGSLIIGVINNGMDLLNVNMYWQEIVKGVIIVVAVIIDSRRHSRK